jgi:hypothetical protein
MQDYCLKNKKGIKITLSTLIGIFIAAICVALLFYSGAKWLSLFTPQSKELVQAKETLSNIRKAVSDLPIGEISADKIILQPAGWWLISFDKDKETVSRRLEFFKRESQRPDKCKDEDCICICRKTSDCTKKAFCDTFKKPLYKDNQPIALKIELAEMIYIKNTENFYEVVEKNFMEDFDPEFIISDSEFSDSYSMDKEEIQDLLESKNSMLADYGENGKSAAQIIHEVSVEYNINPKVLIATLQKEQSLIEKRFSKSEFNKRVEWAVGCGKKGLFKGLEQQIKCAAQTFRNSFDGKSKAGYKIGESIKTLDGEVIKLENWATVALYTYTPYVKKNNFFWQIYKEYFW